MIQDNKLVVTKSLINSLLHEAKRDSITPAQLAGIYKQLVDLIEQADQSVTQQLEQQISQISTLIDIPTVALKIDSLAPAYYSSDPADDSQLLIEDTSDAAKILLQKFSNLDDIDNAAVIARVSIYRSYYDPKTHIQRTTTYYDGIALFTPSKISADPRQIDAISANIQFRINDIHVKGSIAFGNPDGTKFTSYQANLADADSFVLARDGYDLSECDYTDADRAKLHALPTAADLDSVNSQIAEIFETVTIPTVELYVPELSYDKFSDLENKPKYIYEGVLDLTSNAIAQIINVLKLQEIGYERNIINLKLVYGAYKVIDPNHLYIIKFFEGPVAFEKEFDSINRLKRVSAEFCFHYHHKFNDIYNCKIEFYNQNYDDRQGTDLFKSGLITICNITAGTRIIADKLAKDSSRNVRKIDCQAILQRGMIPLGAKPGVVYRNCGYISLRKSSSFWCPDGNGNYNLSWDLRHLGESYINKIKQSLELSPRIIRQSYDKTEDTDINDYISCIFKSYEHKAEAVATIDENNFLTIVISGYEYNPDYAPVFRIKTDIPDKYIYLSEDNEFAGYEAAVLELKNQKLSLPANITVHAVRMELGKSDYVDVKEFVLHYFGKNLHLQLQRKRNAKFKFDGYTWYHKKWRKSDLSKAGRIRKGLFRIRVHRRGRRNKNSDWLTFWFNAYPKGINAKIAQEL